MYVYHFCVQKQLMIGSIAYYDGLMTRGSVPKTEEDYRNVKTAIAEKFGIDGDPSNLSIISFSYLGTS